MIAIRAVMRIGWEVPNPINALNPDNSTRFPFSVVLPSPAETKLDLTFTVTDGDSTPVQNATVMCAGVEKKTNAAGEAVFKVNGNTTYTYAVKSEGKQANMSKVEVQAANKSVNITLLGE